MAHKLELQLRSKIRAHNKEIAGAEKKLKNPNLDADRRSEIVKYINIRKVAFRRIRASLEAQVRRIVG